MTCMPELKKNSPLSHDIFCKHPSVSGDNGLRRVCQLGLTKYK